jgi:hypothetical protein
MTGFDAVERESGPNHPWLMHWRWRYDPAGSPRTRLAAQIDGEFTYNAGYMDIEENLLENLACAARMARKEPDWPEASGRYQIERPKVSR